MYVLCDTGAVLMLLRLAPDMFADPRFGCTTLGSVWDEFTRTERFASRYPWRGQYADRIVPVDGNRLEAGGFRRNLAIVRATAENHRNERTGLPYGLSRVDREVAAGVLSLDATISTTDTNLREFLEQQFAVPNLPPLALLNRWLENGLLEWDGQKQAVIADWVACREPSLRGEDIRHFEHLTRFRYPSSHGP